MNKELASNLIEHATQLLERKFDSVGSVNLAAARMVGNASQLLGFTGRASRCEHFLKTTSADSFWNGAITNIPIDRDSVSDGSRKLTPLEQLEREYPVFSMNYAKSVLTPAMGDHIGACSTHNYNLAFLNAGSNEFQWHEVVVAQAINGDLSLALTKLPDITSSTIRSHVQLVFAIESYRHGDTTTGLNMYNQLQLDGINEYTAAHLALGVTNRVPWVFYPFADY